MEIIVNSHTIQLTQSEIVNEGEYNIQKCNFTFSEEYNGLTKIAIFSNLNNSFQTMITNGSCIIPAEILQQEGTLILGVYGYEVDGETLIKRYSPTPACFTVSKGSYQLASEVEPPSPSIVEQLEQQISELSDEITTINNIIPTLALKSEIPTKTSQLTNDSGFIDKNVNDLTNYTKTNDLSAVATSGDYDDLLNKPAIPTVPTNVSAFNNDVGYITNSVDNLLNYYKKSETFTKQEVNDLISAITTMDLQVVQTLPTEDISTTTIYLVPKNPAETNNAYDEYIYVSNAWEFIGSTEVDLTDYVKNTDYASDSKGGVIKTGVFGTFIGYNNALGVQALTYQLYQTQGNNYAISKGTLENVITGKDLTTKGYVDGLVGDIGTALDEINGEIVGGV